MPLPVLVEILHIDRPPLNEGVMRGGPSEKIFASFHLPQMSYTDKQCLSGNIDHIFFGWYFNVPAMCNYILTIPYQNRDPCELWCIISSYQWASNLLEYTWEFQLFTAGYERLQAESLGVGQQRGILSHLVSNATTVIQFHAEERLLTTFSRDRVRYWDSVD